MPTRLSDCRRNGLLAAALAVAVVVLVLVPSGGKAADSYAGRIIADIIPVNNHVHPPEQILNIMKSRPGRPYDDAVMQEDIKRLIKTNWFDPNQVQPVPKIDSDGRVTVFIYVRELIGTVQEVVFIGADHLSESDRKSLVGIKKGDPMNPMANELGREAILRRYQQEENRAYASVTLLEGSQPTDTRVVYSVVEGPVVKVAGVEFRGQVNAQSGRLRTQLATSSTILGLGGKFNAMSIDADRQKLADYYHALGYLAVKITPEVIPSPDLSRVKIVYYIDEGIQYMVANRQIENNHTFTTKTLESLTEVKPDTRYDIRQVTTDAKRIETYYGNRGYQVHVAQNLFEVPDQQGLVQVQYDVIGDKGKADPDRVGQILIQGNTVTRDRVIQNQLDIFSGQILQYPKLEEAQMRLARLGIFDTENKPKVTVRDNEYDSNYKDVLVQIQETRTGQFMIGAGVNSNSGINGSIVLNERNFDITRFPTSWSDFGNGTAFRGNGEEFRLEAAPGTQFQRYTATWRAPYIFDTPFSFTNSLYYFNRAYVEYTEDRIGDRITLDRRLDAYWSVSGSARFEGVNVRDLNIADPFSIAEYYGWHYQTGLRAGIRRDSRDSYLTPTSGSVFNAGVEEVIGQYTFPIATADYTKFFSSEYLQRADGSGKHVLAIRSQVGFEGDNAPVFERFYAGGFNSLRGFSFRGVGPATNGMFTGGTFSFLNTIEYQIPILANDKLHFVTFVDHGTVEQNIDILNYRVAAGFGFRISIPALGPVPIALDFAFPIVKAPQDNRQMFSFYVGMFGGQ